MDAFNGALRRRTVRCATFSTKSEEEAYIALHCCVLIRELEKYCTEVDGIACVVPYKLVYVITGCGRVRIADSSNIKKTSISFCI